MLLAILVSLLPVTVFLAVLLLFDSFKLVPTSMLARALLAGVLAAAIGTALHMWLFHATGLAPVAFSRYVAPITEETLKTLFVLYALRRRQIGFLVDAAIVGFAIGAGFAVVENIGYLQSLPDQRILVWVARGFGTAVLHATTTAIIAMSAKSLSDRYPTWLVVVPGWAGAVVLHSIFNHTIVSPLISTGILLVVLPLVVLVVFERSERLTHEWVGDGLDLDVELLKLVRSSQFGNTRLGNYLRELTTRFPGPVVADMFCLLQLELELAISAKGMLMARRAGLEVPMSDDVRANLVERDYLRRAIGPTGLLALRPLHVSSDRDEWNQYFLHQAGGRRARWMFWKTDS